MIGARGRRRAGAGQAQPLPHHGRGQQLTPADEAFASLLGAARTNSGWAWETIYRDLAPRLLGWLRLERPELAEEVLGETFLAVVRDLHQFSGTRAAFQAWVFRIARNRLLDACRASARRPEVLVEAFDMPAPAAGGSGGGVVCPDVAEQVIAGSERERLVRMLGALPADQRTTIYLRYVLDLPLAEVAATLQTSVPAVKMLQQRGLRTLATRLRPAAAS